MDIPADYQAALSGAAFHPLTQIGTLRLGGPDRRPFVQRQTSNNINLLKAGEAQATVLTSPTGRILDVLQVHLTGSGDEEALLLHPLPRRSPDTFRYLKSRIFFMDKVTLQDDSAEFSHFLLTGPQSGAVLQTTGLGSLPAPQAVVAAEFQGLPLTLIGLSGPAGPACQILIPADATASLEHALEAAGACRLSSQVLETLRIETGLPAADHELTESYTPLESGLAVLVAENKGCYTGQEVLARQVNYDKITRQLTGLRLEELLPAGSEVFAEGRPVGVITSATHSPRYGFIALAIVKRPYYEPGSVLTAGSKDHHIPAVPCSLPFS